MTESLVLERVVPPPPRTFFAMVTLICDVCRVPVTRRQVITPAALPDKHSDSDTCTTEIGSGTAPVRGTEPEWICHTCLKWIFEEVKRRKSELAKAEAADARRADPSAKVTKAPQTLDRTTCFSAKVFYPDERKAQKALREWRAIRLPGQYHMDIYPCLACGGWHLTHTKVDRNAVRNRHYGA